MLNTQKQSNINPIPKTNQSNSISNMKLSTNANFLYHSKPEDSKRRHNFGIFNIETSENNEMNPGKYHIIATCDRTGSMDDMCGDGKSKMDHLKHTLKNIVRYFANRYNIHLESAIRIKKLFKKYPDIYKNYIKMILN